MTEQLELNKALERYATHAAANGLTPPAQLTNADGTLSDEATRFWLDSGLTCDWMFIREGQKHWRAQV